MQKYYPDRIIKKLANLQLAIGLLLTIGIVVALGTFIEQDQSLAFYKQNYPYAKPILGFLNWEIITFLNFDHIYTAWWFLLLLFIFARGFGASWINFFILKPLPPARITTSIFSLKLLCNFFIYFETEFSRTPQSI